MLKRLEGGGSACSKGHAVSEENGESAAQGPTRESPAAAPIPTVLNKVGAGSRRRIRNREWVGDSMKVQKVSYQPHTTQELLFPEFHDSLGY